MTSPFDSFDELHIRGEEAIRGCLNRLEALIQIAQIELEQSTTGKERKKFLEQFITVAQSAIINHRDFDDIIYSLKEIEKTWKEQGTNELL